MLQDRVYLLMSLMAPLTLSQKRHLVYGQRTADKKKKKLTYKDTAALFLFKSSGLSA